jgi:hypothetical protein
MKKPLSWIPWHIDSWLFGSSRNELTRAQRSDFVDLALLSGKDEGYIRANPTTPYPIEQLAGMLRLNAEELAETIEKCIEVKKITRLENGVLYITNYDVFRLTPQWRRQIDKRRSSPLPSSKNKSNKRRGEERKGKGNTISKRGNGVSQKRNFPPSSSRTKDETDKDGLLPIPEHLDFKVKDELQERRAEIRRLSRLIDRGISQDGDRRISAEGIEKRKAAFNDLVRDYCD